jgi:hypothetical protein
MLRVFLILAALVVAGVLAWEFIPIQIRINDGWYDLTVRVSSTDEGLESVICQTFGRYEVAKETLENLLPPEAGSYTSVANPFVGAPLKVRAFSSYRESLFGRVLQQSQSEYLLVIGQFKDGQRVGKLVRIPDVGVSREISVELP